MYDIMASFCLRRVKSNALAIFAAPPVGMPDDCILHDKSKYAKVHKSGRSRWRDKDGNLYEWDALHGEIEVYNKKGKHLATKNSKGRTTSGPVPGRKINLR